MSRQTPEQKAIEYRCNLRAIEEFPDAENLRAMHQDLRDVWDSLEQELAAGAGSNTITPLYYLLLFVTHAYRDVLHHATRDARLEAFKK